MAKTYYETIREMCDDKGFSYPFTISCVRDLLKREVTASRMTEEQRASVDGKLEAAYDELEKMGY